MVLAAAFTLLGESCEVTGSGGEAHGMRCHAREHPAQAARHLIQCPRQHTDFILSLVCDMLFEVATGNAIGGLHHKFERHEAMGEVTPHIPRKRQLPAASARRRVPLPLPWF